MHHIISHRLESMLPTGILPDVERVAGAHQHVGTSLLGRSFEEATADLKNLVESLQPRKITPAAMSPLLLSDTDSSPPSTPNNWSPLFPSFQLSSDPSSPISPDLSIMSIKQVNLQEIQCQTDIRTSFKPLHLYLDKSTDVSVLPELPSSEVVAPTPPALSLPLTHSGPSTQRVIDAIEAMNMLRFPIPPLLESAPNVTETDALRIGANSHRIHDEACVGQKKVPLFTASGEHLPSLQGQNKQTKQKRLKLTGPFVCTYCPDITFTRNYDLKRHTKTVHQKDDASSVQARTCPCCYEVLSRGDAYRLHCRRVPDSCLRHSQLLKKPPPPSHPEHLYKSVREQAEKTFKKKRK